MNTDRAPRLVSVSTALPAHTITQPEARAFIARLFEDALGKDPARLLAVFDNSGIATRHACMPLEWYAVPHDFGETNARYVEHALLLATTVARNALDRAGLSARDVTHLMFVSSTGIATPSIDARLAATAGFARDVRRVPLWGLGCAGGAAGIARAADFARSRPDAVVLMVALELCSLAFQPRDRDVRTIIASALFSDGAAAVVVTGAERAIAARGSAGPVLEIAASGSTLWPDTVDMMGWTVDAQGLHVVFSRDIPSFVRDEVRPDLEGFLERSGVSLATLDHIVAHPGGPKVLAAYSEALGLDPERFRHARAVLNACGNMSSPTCLFALEAALASGDIRPGDSALVAALGPGFASEYVLMRAATD